MLQFEDGTGKRNNIECVCVFFFVGHKPSLHSKQPRELHHVPLPSRLYQPFQLLMSLPQFQTNWLYIMYIKMYNIDFFCFVLRAQSVSGCIFSWCMTEWASGSGTLMQSSFFRESTQASGRVQKWKWVNVTERKRHVEKKDWMEEGRTETKGNI